MLITSGVKGLRIGFLWITRNWEVFFCVKKVALKSKRKCRLHWNLLLFRDFFLLSSLTAAGSTMVVSAMKCGLFGEFLSGREGKNSGTVVKLPWRESNSFVWLVFIEH